MEDRKKRQCSANFNKTEENLFSIILKFKDVVNKITVCLQTKKGLLREVLPNS